MRIEHTIGNVTYQIERSFSGKRTAADLIKARMVAMDKASPRNALTDSHRKWYNGNSGNKSDPPNDKEAFH